MKKTLPYIIIALVMACLAFPPLVPRDGTTVVVHPPSLTLSQQRDSIVAEEARKAGVPVAYAIAVSHVEDWSGDSMARSTAGAFGIMQVLDKVWHHQFEDECGCGSLFQRRLNACKGVRILKLYKQRFGTWGRAARAYHTGQPHGDEYSDAVLDLVVKK